MCDARAIRVLVAATLLGLLAACGQKGPLYLPEQAREVVTRPAQTPPPSPDAQAPNTPQTVDSPEAPANPAPETTSPKEDDKKPDTTAPR
jgi:predicted small lipoprotein YifL